MDFGQTRLEEGLRYHKIGMLEKALEQYQATAESADDPAVLGEAYRREALVYRSWCKWPEAIDAAQRCASVAREHNLPELYADALNAEAIVHQELGNFDSAIPLYNEMLALPITERLRGVTYQNMGAILAQRADLAGAEEQFRKSRGCFTRAGYPWGEAFALNNAAAIHLDTGKFKLAEVIAGQAMVAAKKVGDLDLLAIASMNAAEAHAGQGGLIRAEVLARSAMEYFEIEENDLRRAQCMRVLGDIKVMQGDPDEALSLYQQAFGLAQSVGSERELSRIRDCLELIGTRDQQRRPA